MKKETKQKVKIFMLNKVGGAVLSATIFSVTLFGIVYAASITSTTQTVNSGDAITANWYQDVNDKLALISGKANSSDVYTKTDLYTKTETNTQITNTSYSKAEIDALLSGYKQSDWRDQDPNCDLADVTIGTQTWAGCNSTLGTGIDYVPGHCYNYAGTNNGSNCGGFSSKESDYNALGVNNIWGKLYTWDNAQNACGTGYHLPSYDEWTTAMVSLGCSSSDATIADGNWRCAGLGWKNNGTLKDKLKLPLAGYRNSDGVSFNYRGHNTGLWASSVSGSDGRGVFLRRHDDTVRRNSRNKSYGFSVRCIKD